MEEASRATEAPAHAMEASGNTTVATPAATIVSIELSRKRKRGFSTLR
jgi:hypothetical protein